MPTSTAVAGAPIVHRASFYFDCSIAGHIAPEADCRLAAWDMCEAIGLLDDESTTLPVHAIESLVSNENPVTL